MRVLLDFFRNTEKRAKLEDKLSKKPGIFTYRSFGKSLLASVIVLSSLALSACGTDEDTEYLKAEQGSILKVPAGLSSDALQAEYPVPAGAVWHSSEPVADYPPGSSLAKKMHLQQKQASQTVTLGVDDQGASALNFSKPYQEVWQHLSLVLQQAGYKVLHSDKTIGLVVVQQRSNMYQFTLLETLQGGSVLSVRDTQGVALGDSESNKIMQGLEQQFTKVWK